MVTTTAHVAYLENRNNPTSRTVGKFYRVVALTRGDSPVGIWVQYGPLTSAEGSPAGDRGSYKQLSGPVPMAEFDQIAAKAVAAKKARGYQVGPLSTYEIDWDGSEAQLVRVVAVRDSVSLLNV